MDLERSRKVGNNIIRKCLYIGRRLAGLSYEDIAVRAEMNELEIARAEKYALATPVNTLAKIARIIEPTAKEFEGSCYLAVIHLRDYYLRKGKISQLEAESKPDASVIYTKKFERLELPSIIEAESEIK